LSKCFANTVNIVEIIVIPKIPFIPVSRRSACSHFCYYTVVSLKDMKIGIMMFLKGEILDFYSISAQILSKIPELVFSYKI